MRGLSLVAVPLVSLVASCGAQVLGARVSVVTTCGLGSCGAWA